MTRKIIHVDMDAFYAAIEQRDQPEWRDRPLVVGARPDQRGVVAAASYAARRYGIHSAMPSRTAVQRCPDLIFVAPRFDHYRAISAEIHDIFRDYTDLIEPLALDEAYLDVTGCQSASQLAREIRQRIFDTTQLTASAGISFNKFLAKVASGHNKPNGQWVIKPEAAADFIATLPIAKFHGIGPATAKRMQALKIETGADLCQWSEADLVAHFGKSGRHYYRIAQGLDDRPVNPQRLRKSIGAEQSFATDLQRPVELEHALSKLAVRVRERLQRAQRQGRTLTLKIKYSNYEQVTRACTLTTPIEETDVIYELAVNLLQRHWQRDRSVRLLGIAISHLVALDQAYIQLSLPV
ncbi:MAG: DNA polymerase IV [Cyanobacteria bacterium P01_H01_bin.121]